MMDHVLTCLSKPTEYTTSRVNPNVNDRLGVIMMCQRWFPLGKKYTILVSDVGRGHASVQAESMQGISALLSQFCCKP